MTFALSSMWIQHRFDDIRSFAHAAAEIGFPAVELSHTVTQAQIQDLHQGDVTILAVHYPAPTLPSPYRVSADILLSSPNDEARAWAVAQGKRCLQFAAEMNAQAVCIHLGQVDMPVHFEWALEQRYVSGSVSSPIYTQLRDQIIDERARRQAAHFEAARRSLDALAEAAAGLNLRIGIESRRQYREIPTWDELAILLDEHDPQRVGFWYDMGHVQVLANLGFHEHQAWLDAFADRIVGIHFHDVIGLRDHLLPGMGELDFAHIAAYLPVDAVRTLEIDWYYEGTEVQQGLAHARSTGCL